jgi:hypothetical protein
MKLSEPIIYLKDCFVLILVKIEVNSTSRKVLSYMSPHFSINFFLNESHPLMEATRRDPLQGSAQTSS